MDPSDTLRDIRQRHERGWEIITSLLFFGEIGKKLVQPDFHTLTGEISEYLISHPRWTKTAQTFQNLEACDQDAIKSSLAKTMIENATAAIYAALIVFSHSVFDSTLDDLLKLSFALDPAHWEPQVMKEEIKTSYAKLKETPLDAYRRIALEKLLKRLKSQSLPKKVEALCRFCKPESGHAPFDAEALTQFDVLRNGIVHGDRLGQPLADMQAMLVRVGRSSEWVIDMVGEKCPPPS